MLISLDDQRQSTSFRCTFWESLFHGGNELLCLPIVRKGKSRLALPLYIIKCNYNLYLLIKR